MRNDQRLLISGLLLIAIIITSLFARQARNRRTPETLDTTFNGVYHRFVSSARIEANVNEEWRQRYKGVRVTWTGRFVKNIFLDVYLKNIGVASSDASVVARLESEKAVKALKASDGRPVVYSGILDTYDVESGLIRLTDFSFKEAAE